MKEHWAVYPSFLRGVIFIFNYDDFVKNYWRYYLLLENKFLQTVNYVEITRDNFSTYSVEYAYLLQSIGGELDTFFKVYCDFPLDDDSKDMSNYHDTVIAKYPDIISQKIVIQEYDLELQPFKGWSHGSGKWWRAYNSVKHNRYGNIRLASLSNVLNILAALFLLEMKYLKEHADTEKEPDIPTTKSTLFSLPDWKFEYMTGGEGFVYLLNHQEELLPSLFTNK